MDQLRLCSFARFVGTTAGGDAWVLGFQQGWRDAHQHLGDIQGPSRVASSRCRMQRKAHIVSWSRWNRWARWGTNPSRDNCAASRCLHGSYKDYRTRRSDELEVLGSDTCGKESRVDDCSVSRSAVSPWSWRRFRTGE